MASGNPGAVQYAAPKPDDAPVQSSLRQLPEQEQLNLAMATVFGDGPPEMYIDADTSYSYEDDILMKMANWYGPHPARFWSCQDLANHIVKVLASWRLFI